jgi:HD-GYP domain-containing protein (c-di-GMP phosphodiesterase class II)
MKIEEMRYVRLHAKLGSELVRKEGYGDEIGDIVLYHHENYDGSGYPFRMQGEEIPLGSRIIRVCDVFVALISDRAYRKAFDPETALLMVIDEVRHFDMKIFLAFQRIINTTDVLSEIEMILDCGGK